MKKHDPTEDIPYTRVDDFAVAESDANEDDEFATSQQVINREALKNAMDYLDKRIDEENSLDSINIPVNATDEQKVACFNEMAIHKGLAMDLRNVKTIINEIITEG